MIRRFLCVMFVTIVASLALPATIFATYVVQAEQTEIRVLASLGLVIEIALVALLFCFLRRSESTIEELSRQQTSFLDRLPDRWIMPGIFLSAALSLVLELVLIRWQGSVSPLFALYKNFGLLACLSGLGLGYSISGRRSLPLVLTLPLLLWQMLILVVIKSTGERG